MDHLLKMRRIINTLFDEEAEPKLDKEGKHIDCFRPGDAIKFYDKGNDSSRIRIRKAMNQIKDLAHEVRMEVQRLKKRSRGEY